MTAAERIGAWACAALILSTTGSVALAAEGLVSHRAIYRIALSSTQPQSSVTAAKGAMHYSFAETCDGWNVENQTFISFSYTEGTTAETTWSFASTESKDGLRYRFRVRNDRDGETVDRLQGDATLKARGAAGVARFVQPEAEEVELPAGTLFPTRHVQELLAAARAGTKSFNRVVFDGSSQDNPYEVSAVMLSPIAADGAPRPKGLGPSRIWPVQLAFFPHDGQGDLPEFELSVRYREDGIADRLVQDVDDIVLDLELTEIELLPKPTCQP